jgi:hypothetical protein
MDAPVAGRPWFSRPVLSYDLQARVHVICKETTGILCNMKRTPFARIRLKRDEFTTRGKILSREELDREELDWEEFESPSLASTLPSVPFFIVVDLVKEVLWIYDLNGMLRKPDQILIRIR